MPKRNAKKVELPPEPSSSEPEEGLDAEELDLSTDEEGSDGERQLFSWRPANA